MQWRGCASVDPRFSAAMLPWTIADIYSREQFTNVSKKVFYMLELYRYTRNTTCGTIFLKRVEHIFPFHKF